MHAPILVNFMSCSGHVFWFSLRAAVYNALCGAYEVLFYYFLNVSWLPNFRYVFSGMLGKWWYWWFFLCWRISGFTMAPFANTVNSSGRDMRSAYIVFIIKGIPSFYILFRPRISYLAYREISSLWTTVLAPQSWCVSNNRFILVTVTYGYQAFCPVMSFVSGALLGVLGPGDIFGLCNLSSDGFGHQRLAIKLFSLP